EADVSISNGVGNASTIFSDVRIGNSLVVSSSPSTALPVDDTVRVVNTQVGESISLLLGNGTNEVDTAFIQVGPAFNYIGRAGIDAVGVMDGRVGTDLTFSDPGGDNGLGLEGGTFIGNNVTYFGGPGMDTVNLDDIWASGVTLNPGNGSSIITIDSLRANTFS